MFELTFLGTSASVPSATRNHPGLLVEAGGRRIMVDCGEGTQRQLLRSGIQSRSRDIGVGLYGARRSVIRVSSDGRPSRSAKPGHSPVPLFT
jgi:ribonuclease BN (tRNA processing enzyme)